MSVWNGWPGGSSRQPLRCVYLSSYLVTNCTTIILVTTSVFHGAAPLSILAKEERTYLPRCGRYDLDARDFYKREHEPQSALTKSTTKYDARSPSPNNNCYCPALKTQRLCATGRVSIKTRPFEVGELVGPYQSIRYCDQFMSGDAQYRFLLHALTPPTASPPDVRSGYAFRHVFFMSLGALPRGRAH